MDIIMIFLSDYPRLNGNKLCKRIWGYTLPVEGLSLFLVGKGR